MNAPALDIHAPEISTYGRIVAMVAEECGVTWRIVPTATGSPELRTMQPFGRSPAVRIDGEVLYESAAIAVYLDERGDHAPRLQPADPLARARMWQWIGVANMYLFPLSEHGLVLPRLVHPLIGRAPDEAAIARALPQIAIHLDIVCERLETSRWLAGDAFSLADVFAWCVLRAVQRTPEGAELCRLRLPLARWLAVVARRPSAIATAWPGECS